VDALRWRAPQPAAAWSDVRDATKFGSGCIATSVDLTTNANQVIGGSEDCLTLNVWTKTVSPAQPMPVMVFIHGGFFQQGSSADTFGGVPSYDGAYIAAHQPAVFVSLNYRLGALGFMANSAILAADPDHRAGNYGLLDQIAALAWVKANIAAFGGDSTRVMVFGESAGAYAVCNLVASPLAKGLFSSALMESGGCDVWPRATALAYGAKVQKALGCDGAADVPACMRAASASAAATAIPAYSFDYEFAPSVDPGVLGRPLSVFADGRQNKVPVVIGTNADELSSLLESYLAKPLTSDAEYKATLELQYGTVVGDLAYAQYPSARYANPTQAYIQVRSDSDFTCPARAIARALSKTQSAPVRRYFYTHVLDEGPYRYQRAGHGYELIFVFHAFDPITFPKGASVAELQLSTDIIGYWTRFAQTGDPTGPGAAPWPVYDATDPYLVIDETFSTGAALHAGHSDFWDKEYPEG
jgi:para-nitrobenzyl esterase